MHELLQQFDYFLIDLWGVLWDGRETFPDAMEFVRRLIAGGKKIFFLSNSAEYVVEALVQRLKEAGLENAGVGMLVTSGQAMEQCFQRNGLVGKSVYVFAGKDVWENVRRAGALPIELPEHGLELKKHKESDTLVVGGMLNFEWTRMIEVVTAVNVGRLRIVLPNPDMVVYQRTGRITLPPGMVTHIIETAVPGVQVERLGKPYRAIYDYALSRWGAQVSRDRVLMIGDSLETDIRGANNAEVKSLLLGQGVHQSLTLDEIRRSAIDHQIYPDFFAQRLSPDSAIIPLDWRHT
ncbi:MAG: TIGR01459 family HAD-type hydrolase [Candidatus Sumerlaeota bacterium]|nr:TIGR01459 family HAD-type hydrolase [Candidatus Sumerlaeota bacterium]